MFKNHQNFLKLRNKINEQETQHADMFQSINDKLQDKNFLEQAAQISTTSTEKVQTKATAADGDDNAS